MRAIARRLHIVYVFRGIPREAEQSLVQEILTLESLGHRVTVISRLRRMHRKVWRTFSKIQGAVRFVDEDDPSILLRAFRSHLALFLRGPLKYRRQYRAAMAEDLPNVFRRFLHAGMLAHEVRRAGADHLHFMSDNSRIARFVSSLSGLSYSVSTNVRDGQVRGGVTRFVAAGNGADPAAVELLIGVTEDPKQTVEALAKPLVLVVGCPRALRGSLGIRLRQQGFEYRDERRAGLLPERLLDPEPDVVLAGAHDDGTDAFRLLKRLRSGPAGAQVPFILMPEEDDKRLRLEAFKRGADGLFLATHDVEELLAQIDNLLKRRNSGGQNRRRRRGISGQLENLPLPEIIQVLTMGNRTACVSLSLEDGIGKIWFDRGKIMHATLGALRGEDAFFALMQWSRGEFNIQHGVAPPRTTIEEDAMFLVMEALRRADEAALAAG